MRARLFQSFLTIWDPMDCSLPSFSRPLWYLMQEYWRGLPCPPPGNLPDPEIEPMSPALPGGSFTTSTIWEEEVITNNWLSVSKPRDARPCEDTVRRGPSTSQEERPHQQPTLMAPLILNFQPPKLWENNCPLSHPVHDTLLWWLGRTNTPILRLLQSSN